MVATSNLTLSGVQAIDGVPGTAGTTIVLATAQTTAAQNGPWVMQTGSWTRPAWYPSGGTTQAVQFATEFVRLGAIYQGTTWRLTTAAPITIDTTATAWAQTPLAPLTNYRVDVVADCGAVGDGVTDDCSAIQACITNHPGKQIFFPKMRSTPCTSGSGGGCAGSVDFSSSCSFKLSGNSQSLEGQNPSLWPAGRDTNQIRRQSDRTRRLDTLQRPQWRRGNLLLTGQACWTSTTLSTWPYYFRAFALTGLGPDGVLMSGGWPTIENVTAYCFARHGFAILG